MVRIGNHYYPMVLYKPLYSTVDYKKYLVLAANTVNYFEKCCVQCINYTLYRSCCMCIGVNIFKDPTVYKILELPV
jgi:hypothetical protein